MILLSWLTEIYCKNRHYSQVITAYRLDHSYFGSLEDRLPKKSTIERLFYHNELFWLVLLIRVDQTFLNVTFAKLLYL